MVASLSFCFSSLKRSQGEWRSWRVEDIKIEILYIVKIEDYFIMIES